MPDLIVVKNPLSPLDREHFALDVGARPIDWLVEHYPPEQGGCNGALRFWLNGRERDLDDLDVGLAEGDVAVFAIQPGFEAILISLAVSAILTAASMVLQLLFAKPKPPAFARPEAAQPSPVYSVRSSQNTARLGEPVPVPYGTVLHTPDICAQAYKFYFDNDEFLDMLLCLGQGDFTVDQVIVGDTPAEQMTDAVEYQIVPQSVHQNVVGNIAALFTPSFHEDMLTSLEVGEQEFIAIDNTSGWFRMGKAGQVGHNFWIDIVFPAGLYIRNFDGQILATNVSYVIDIVQADADGAPIVGTEQQFAFNHGGAGPSPLRFTDFFDAGINASWLVKMTRTTPQNPGTGPDAVTRYIWAGLRMRILIPGSQFVYGNTTLLAVRLKATQLASSSNNQIRVKLIRNLPVLGSGAAVATDNPADAFVDILTNLDYGARRPLAEVDVARLTALRPYWQDPPNYSYGFNAVYTGRTTVWEALTDVMQVVAASPLPLGALMSVAQDGIKNVRSILFSEQNMTHDSFGLTYSFDRDGDFDGVEVEYRNPLTFAPAFARWPTTSADPEKLDLFGCTNAQHAQEFARLEWQRRGGNRRAVHFETELEGLIPILGERAAVAHTLPFWGQSGQVVDKQGLTITLDRNLAWDDFTAPYVITFRDEHSGLSKIVQCTQGAAANIAVLAEDPWAGTGGGWSLSLEQELTHFAFGDATTVVKDFIISRLEPDGSRVRVTGAYYDPAVYANTLAFLANPVP